ncbi:hypothetical protein CIL05_17450 [Virgibacillus profundi]|uniref:Uncharacterized protein n=1 Tax=Virgibacillus profundi TaxID=2024555 RepID=A0A2A2IAK3_9BACI|nr:hypothetical protein [Virgibacillus profundi]PAV28418.1 hypothetical protein CIL05_17450 [Virgibacillus profundi]PXY52220.1 hypothetical protein CIT14_18325 [Virgibacillus profundi]
MPIKILTDNYGIPLEREFEAWIVKGIREYFKQIDENIEIVAVSPKEEKKYPADASFFHNGKVIGLQFKRPKFKELGGKYIICYSRMEWDIDKPEHQYDLIKNNNNIYYALPTFINRAWQENALHHCFFWRPNKKDKHKYVWYNNSNANISLLERTDAYRWGTFIEQIYSDNIGVWVGKKGKHKNVYNYINDFLSWDDHKKELNDEQSKNRKTQDNESFIGEQEDNSIYYFIFIPMNEH